MKRTIAEIEIETKKGAKTVTRWLITQARPYPSISGASGYFRWQGGGGLLPECGNPAQGIGKEYRAELLRDDKEPENLNSRAAFAGFEGAPGCIVLRGQSLGETSAEIRLASVGAWEYVTFKVRGYGAPTGGERAFLESQVAPGMVKACKDNAAALKAEAIKGLRAGLVEKMKDTRARLDMLEAELRRAIDAEEART